jgi:hypothetical protein
MSDSMSKKVADRFLKEAMANMRTRRTGIDGVVIWVSPGEFSGADSQHGPRIKVMLGDKVTTEGLEEAVSVRLTNPPKVLGTLPAKVEKQVVKFINQNRNVLLGHWNGETDTEEMLKLIVSI